MDWNNIQNFAANIVFGTLLLTTILYWASFIFRDIKLLETVAKTGVLGANVLLFVTLASRWVIAGYFPLSNLYESLLFLTWTLLTLQIFAEYKTSSNLIGAIVNPVALLLSGFSSLVLPPEMQRAAPLVPALQSNWLMMHVSMMMLSYGTLILGSLLSILFLVLAKNQDITNFQQVSLASTSAENMQLASSEATEEVKPGVDTNRLKLLNNIDNWSYRTIGLGFPFLTTGIISGAVWANEAWGSYWSWDPKETWALITWLIFAVYLHARVTKNWQGKKAAMLGSGGFLVIWICYLGVNFLGTGLHSYGFLS
jgi:cytochrome c-type biogenesis protein CcsB